MITLRINLTELDKSRFYKGEKGIYLNLTCIETPNDQYGNTHGCAQSTTEEERKAGLRMPFIGNAKDYKIINAQKELAESSKPTESDANNGVDQDDIPF